MGYKFHTKSDKKKDRCNREEGIGEKAEPMQ